MRRLIILAVALFTLSSCFVDTSYSTEYIMRPLEQSTSGGEYTPLEGVLLCSGWEQVWPHCYRHEDYEFILA